MTRKELCSALRQGKRVYGSLAVSDLPRFPEAIKLQTLRSAFVALYFYLRKISNGGVCVARCHIYEFECFVALVLT